MKSVEQLARAAYEAFCANSGIPIERWESLHDLQRRGWTSAVQAVRQEIEAVH